MTRSAVCRGSRRARLSGLLVAMIALAAVLTSCGKDRDRPPKPTCQQPRYEAVWDDDDHRWECRSESSGSHNDSHRSRTRSRQ